MSRLKTISDKLDELRRRDPNLDVFGASRHHHRLNPPLAPGELQAFEQEFGVRLPDDFAAFLTQVGDGGAGPEYGLWPLGRVAEGIRHYERWCADHGVQFHRLSEPFPFTADDARRVLEQRAQEGKRGSQVALPVPGGGEENAGGAIPICEYGCGYDAHLVVAGEQRGNVWGSEGGYAFYPCGEDPARMDFLSWYESWLDRWLAPGAIERWANALKKK